jgi:hypothetical protein
MVQLKMRMLQIFFWGGVNYAKFPKLPSRPFGYVKLIERKIPYLKFPLNKFLSLNR